MTNSEFCIRDDGHSATTLVPSLTMIQKLNLNNRQFTLSPKPLS